jgi:hypothetical protein
MLSDQRERRISVGIEHPVENEILPGMICPLGTNHAGGKCRRSAPHTLPKRYPFGRMTEAAYFTYTTQLNIHSVAISACLISPQRNNQAPLPRSKIKRHQ